MNASVKGYKEIVDLLIKSKADLNVQNKYGYTALIWASQTGQKEITELLIKGGANLNIRDVVSIYTLLYYLLYLCLFFFHFINLRIKILPLYKHVKMDTKMLLSC